MKPFNLEEAKAGKPVVTREGKKVKFVAHVPEAREGHKVVFLNEGKILSHYENGRYLQQLRNSDTDSGHDLFMASVKKKAWACVKQTSSGEANFMSGKLFKTKEEGLGYKAMHNSTFSSQVVAVIEIEWEE